MISDEPVGQKTPAGKNFVAGYVLTALAALFLTFDWIIKLLALPIAIQANAQLGYRAETVVWIGVIELVCLGLYLLPRTSVLGAVLMTGYLGGAIASHMRVGDPLFSHTLFPTYIALVLWGGVYLREPRLRALLPVRR